MAIYHALLGVGKQGIGVYPVLIELRARSEKEALKRVKRYVERDEFWSNIKKSPKEYFITTLPEIINKENRKKESFCSKTIELRL